ncbi:MAG: hypothetical protein K2I31_03580, partial [Duncaniella sp.]|nr:hypothetical protein [Duncaniella sp.]
SIAARSISELITCNGLINLDFNDVDSTLRDGGAAIISTGYGEGEERVTKAIRDALNSPLLKNRDILGSKKLLFNLYFNPNAEEKFLMSETREITDFIGSITTDVDVIWGVGFDENLGNGVKMTILASGFDVTLREEEEELMANGMSGFGFGGGKPGGRPATPTPPPAPAKSGINTAPATPVAPKPATPNPSEITDERLAEEYGLTKIKDLTEGKDRTSTIILGLDQLDDDAICDILEKYPTYKRDRKIVESVRTGMSEYVGSHSTSPVQQGGAPGMTVVFG